MLLKILSKILDLPSPLDEARKKLQSTYMELNGELVYVLEIWESRVIYSDKNGDMEEICDPNIKTFNVWLPDCGVYILDGEFYFLSKLPKKQWKRSFSYDFYQFEGKYKTNNQRLAKIFKLSPEPSRLNIVDDRIFYITKEIARIKNGEVICTDTLYKQELIDFCKGSTWKII